jgi:glycosyltransferase involved in cell wall biosynthesis
MIVPGGIGTGKMNMGIPVLEELVKLLANDIDLTVVSLFRVNDDYVAKGFLIISIPDRNVMVKSLKCLWHFWQLHRHNQFDAIHGYWALPSGFLAVMIGILFKVKSVVSVLGGDAASLPSIQYGQLRTSLQRNLVLWTLHHADERTALTQYSVGNLVRAGLRRPVSVIPWGVDTHRFFMKEKALHEPLRFLHVANLTPVKDQETLLKAFELITHKINAELTLIGEGPAKQELISLAGSLGIAGRIMFLGLQPYEEMPDYYHDSDILLHTSLSEGQSEVVTEAMGCGMVICGTSVGLMADLPGACITVNVGDYQSLADHVIYLLENPSRMSELRKKASEWSAIHSIHWTAARTRELYNA